MREITNQFEIEKLNKEGELLKNRTDEQKRNNDYDFNENGEPERCDCGRLLNSHGHCPICDY